MSDSPDHGALLDALEQAGFPRSALVGTGNAMRFKFPNGKLEAHAKDDDEDLMILHLEWRNARVLSAPDQISVQLQRSEARKLGAFLLAWGYAT